MAQLLDQLDNLLRTLLVGRVAGITSPSQVRFQPPDDDWRTAVTNLQVNGQPANALNVYLVDLRENRELRSNERRRSVTNGIVSDERAPTRVDCHYLITAWSPAAVTEQVEPTLDEHALLYRALAVLENASPLNPSRILPAGSAALDAVPELIRRVDLPTSIVPPEGFGKLAEFWGTMGTGHRWRPAIQLTVALPVSLEPQEVGPIVTTRILTVSQAGTDNGGIRAQIGGSVLDAQGEPVPGAWVALETRAGDRLLTVTANTLGRFDLDPVAAGLYQLRARAVGLGERVTEIVVPSPSGEYEARVP